MVAYLFSLIGSGRGSLVSAPRGLASRPLVALPWRRVAGLALASGAVRWRLRSSGRSWSGAVVVAGFGSAAAASAFCGRVAPGCGLPLAVRHFSGVWGVSVPVAVPPSLVPRLAVPGPLPPVRVWASGGFPI